MTGCYHIAGTAVNTSCQPLFTRVEKPTDVESYTRVPHIVTDVWMPLLSSSENLVLFFIARKTFGYNQEYKRLSNADIRRGTGIKSKDTVRKAVTALVEKGILVQVNPSTTEIDESFIYGINLDCKFGYADPAQIATPAAVILPALPTTSLFASGKLVSLPLANESPAPRLKISPLLNKGKNIPTKQQQQKGAHAIPAPVPVETPVPVAVDSMETKKIDTETAKTTDAVSSTDTEAVKAAIESVCRLGISEGDARDIIAECGAEEVQRQAGWYKERTRGKSIAKPGGMLRTFCRKSLGSPTLPQEAPAPAKAVTRGEDPNLARIKAWAKEIQPTSWSEFRQSRGIADPTQEGESASTGTDRTPRGKWDIGGGRPIRRPQSRYEPLGGDA